MSVVEAEREAAALLDSAWWPETGPDAARLPVDPFEIADELRIEWRLGRLPLDQSGRLEIRPDASSTITLNKADHPNRRRFTCAHEIGHYIQRRNEPDSQHEVFTDYRSTLAGLGVNEREVFANQFAAALLMPATLVARMRSDGASVADLADRFGTSSQAMEIRLKNLRLP